MRKRILLLAAPALLLLPAPAAGPDPSENNRGVALMFQGKYAEARQAFTRAGSRVNEGIAAFAQRQYGEAEKLLSGDARNVRALYNLGLLYRATGRLEDAYRQFAAVEKLDAGDLHTQYYLGAVSFALRRYPDAIRHYRQVVDADPSFVSAYFGLGRSYVLSGEPDKGQVYLKRFQELTAGSKLNEPVGQQYGEQGQYGLAEESPRAGAAAPPAIPVTFTLMPTAMKGGGPGVCFTGRDLFVPGGDLYRLPAFNPEGWKIEGLGCAAADYDGDGAVDLAVATADRAILYRGGKRALELAGGGTVAFLDFDHDGWLDVLAGHRLYRNKGDGTFTDVSAASKIAARRVRGIAATDYDNRRDIDLVLVHDDGPVLYSNARDGSFKALAPWPEGAVAGASAVVVFDYNNDGWMDLFLTRSPGCPVLLENGPARQFRPVALPDCGEKATSAAAALDYDNDGFRDVVYSGAQGLHLLRNLGNGKFEEVTARTGLKAPAARAIVAGDIDDDGDTDLVIIPTSGAPVALRNDGGNRHGSVKVRLDGLKDNRSGIGTKVEMRAGRAAHKVEISGGSGISQSSTEVIFGLGAAKSADYVRMLWPTGVWQDELPGAAVRLAYKEIDRKGGSCPILYAWDGRRFRFLSDILGAGVIGEWVSPGVYNESDPDEYLVAEGVQPRGGRYLFRLASQMEEVTYFDAARLLVVDHPEEVMVMPNEVFMPGGPPFKLWKLRAARAVPVQQPEVRRTRYMGFAAPHSTTLDLRGSEHADALLLYGWTEYFDSKSNYAAYHAGLRPEFPKLEVSDGRGGWRTAREYVGFPAGLPKWMVVDIAGLRASALRITTNMEVYWQRAVAGRHDPAAPARITELAPSRAELRFLGYPRETARRPEAYDYHRASPRGPYAIHAGAYTRYGDVTELLQAGDDRYAVMASGDEVALEFDARRLPALPAGWKRTVIFKGVGYEKGMDFLNPHPHTVTPLPLRAGESAAVLDYRLRYNIRVLKGTADERR